jgi:hypothetical protein
MHGDLILLVIPGRALARTRNPGGGAGWKAVWIPGSREDARPGMTGLPAWALP